MFSKPVFYLHDVIGFWIGVALVSPAFMYFFDLEQNPLYFKGMFVGATSFALGLLVVYLFNRFRK